MKIFMGKTKLIAAFMIVSSILLLMVSGFFYLRAHCLISSTQRVAGKIVELREARADGRMVYYPVFTFSDSTGVEHTITSKAGSFPPPFQVGEAVTVFYAPRYPKEAMIDSLGQLWLMPICLFIVALTTMVFGLVPVFLSMPRNRMRRLLILASLMIFPFMLGAVFIHEFVAIDAALDIGASWDYVAMKPDFTQSHPYIPFTKRHGTLLTLATLSAFGAAAYAAWPRRQRQD